MLGVRVTLSSWLVLLELSNGFSSTTDVMVILPWLSYENNAPHEGEVVKVWGPDVPPGCCRSLCSLVCKWTYEAHPNGNKGWSEDYFRQIGLSDLMEQKWKKIGSVVKEPGSPCGSGLSKQAAQELGLQCGTPVGTSIIDAHAGGLGMIGCSAGSACKDFETRLSKLSRETLTCRTSYFTFILVFYA